MVADCAVRRVVNLEGRCSSVGRVGSFPTLFIWGMQGSGRSSLVPKVTLSSWPVPDANSYLRETFSTVSQVLVVTFLPNVFSISFINTGPLGLVT